MLTYPFRAPFAIIEVIRPYIEGKTYCELGTREGDIMLEVAKFAKSTIGIEWELDRTEICRAKGLNVIHGDFEKVEIPRAEVYYMWCDSPFQYTCINKCPGLWIFGRRPEDAPFQKYGYEPTVQVPFDEDGHSGIFELLIKEIK
jgi:hypothetical protein